ncbi:hypothetical protein BJ912DRAFT_954029 [Pholiota molesta]|nr:hypothetical protein BJ912DRAFT_954029 [Pholiota molesta]
MHSSSYGPPSPTRGTSPLAILDEGSQPVETQYEESEQSQLTEEDNLAATLVGTPPISHVGPPEGKSTDLTNRGWPTSRGKGNKAPCPARKSAIMGQMLNKSILRPGGALDSQLGSQAWFENEYGPAESSSHSNNPAGPIDLDPAPSGPTPDPVNTDSVDAPMDTAVSSPASVESVDPNDFLMPGHEYQTQVTRAEHHFRAAGFIYKTLLHQHQQLEASLAASRQENDELKAYIVQLEDELLAAKSFVASLTDKILEGWSAEN